MKIRISNLILILLIPGLAEAIDSEVFIITIPGFPLSLGRLLFVLSGIILFIRDRPPIFKNTVFIGFLLIVSGITFASIFSEDSGSLMQSLGFLLLLIGSLGNVSIWEKKWLRLTVDIFFVTLFTYWTIKSLSLTLISGSYSYSEMYQKGQVINHHVPGMMVSISSAYLAVRFFYSENRLKLLGYIVFFISLMTSLFIESRSNFLVSLLMLLYIALRGMPLKVKNITPVLSGLILVVFFTLQIIEKNEVLMQRFSLKDMEYQKRTSGMRFVYLSEGLNEFTNSPLGKGISDTRVEYKGRNLMIHNQYLTFLLGGGILTLIGIMFFFVGFWKVIVSLSRVSKLKSESDLRVMLALAISCITFYITLFTIEMSGILFFLMASYLLYVENKLKLVLCESSS